MAGTQKQEIGSNFDRIKSTKGGVNWDIVSSKLVKPILPQGMNDLDPSKRGSRSPAPNTFINRVATKTGNSAVDTDNIMHLLPDMELAKQVLVASIISPNNLMENDLAFESTADELGDVKAKLVDIAQTHFIDVYKIKKEVVEDLECMLFVPGGKARLLMPEAVVDYAINGDSKLNAESFEKVFEKDGKPKRLGVLSGSTIWGNYDSAVVEGDAKDKKAAWQSFLGGVQHKKTDFLSYAMESYDARGRRSEDAKRPEWLGYSVTDNYNVLMQPKIMHEARRSRLHQFYSPSWVTEGADSKGGTGSRRDINNLFNSDRIEGVNGTVNNVLKLYPDRSYEYTPTLYLKTLADLDRDTIGHPLVLDLPLESVIPVHAPGNPRSHVGYFIIVDRHGNPVHVGETRDWFADIQYQATGTQEMSSRLLSQTRKASEGMRPNDLANMREEASAIYQNIIESELVGSLTGGLMGEDVRIANVPRIFQMMFARACSRMQTQLIFVPAEMMSYLAFDYNEFGVAEGLLDKTKIISGMRAALLFSDTITSMKNSVAHTELQIKLEPDDPEPEVTIEMMMHDYARTRQSSYPLSASSPVDIIQYFDNAGINVSISGHPAYPDSGLVVEPKNMNYAKVDPELQEMLRKQHLMAVGLAPETVDLSMNVDFATSVVSSNILLAKRALNYQTSYCEQKSQFCRIYLINDQIVRDQLLEAIKTAWKTIPAVTKNPKLTPEILLMYFIGTFSITLPKPDVARIEMQQTELDNYIKLLDTAMPAIIDPAFFTEAVLGEMGQSIEQVTASLRSAHLRKWMVDNGIMSELFDMLLPRPDGRPGFTVLEDQTEYVKGLSTALLDWTRGSLIQAGLNNKRLAAIKKATGMEDADLSGGGGTPGNNGGGGGGDDLGGGSDDLGDLSLDTGVDETEEKPTGEEGEGGEPKPPTEPTDAEVEAEKPAGEEEEPKKPEGA